MSLNFKFQTYTFNDLVETSLNLPAGTYVLKNPHILANQGIVAVDNLTAENGSTKPLAHHEIMDYVLASGIARRANGTESTIYIEPVRGESRLSIMSGGIR